MKISRIFSKFNKIFNDIKQLKDLNTYTGYVDFLYEPFNNSGDTDEGL